MKVYIARHAEAVHNLKDTFHDTTLPDVDLTPRGVEQANELAKKLKAVPLDVIYVSGLNRTRQTAEIVNKYYHVPLLVNPLLNDIVSGIAGMPVENFRVMLRESNDPWNAHFPGGESYYDVTQRAFKFLELLKSKPYDDVLIVTSGGIVNNLYGYAHGLSYDEMYPRPVANADWVRIEI